MAVYHLRRVGPPSSRPECANLIDFRKRVTTIGRNPGVVDYIINSTCYVQNACISRRHARVVQQKDNQYKLYDDSRNGVFINDIKIEGHVILVEGDTVTFGHRNGENLRPGTRARQPDSEYQFIFEQCTCRRLVDQHGHCSKKVAAMGPPPQQPAHRTSRHRHVEECRGVGVLVPNSHELPSETELPTPSDVTTPDQHITAEVNAAEISTNGPSTATRELTGPLTGEDQKKGPVEVKQMKKCEKFFSNLLNLTMACKPGIKETIQDLIQQLIDGSIEPQEFRTNMGAVVESSPQLCLVPFLQDTLPLLREALTSNHAQISGIKPPSSKQPSRQDMGQPSVSCSCTSRLPNKDGGKSGGEVAAGQQPTACKPGSTEDANNLQQLKVNRQVTEPEQPIENGVEVGRATKKLMNNCVEQQDSGSSSALQLPWRGKCDSKEERGNTSDVSTASTTSSSFTGASPSSTLHSVVEGSKPCSEGIQHSECMLQRPPEIEKSVIISVQPASHRLQSKVIHEKENPGLNEEQSDNIPDLTRDPPGDEVKDHTVGSLGPVVEDHIHNTPDINDPYDPAERTLVLETTLPLDDLTDANTESESNCVDDLEMERDLDIPCGQEPGFLQSLLETEPSADSLPDIEERLENIADEKAQSSSQQKTVKEGASIPVSQNIDQLLQINGSSLSRSNSLLSGWTYVSEDSNSDDVKQKESSDKNFKFPFKSDKDTESDTHKFEHVAQALHLKEDVISPAVREDAVLHMSRLPSGNSRWLSEVNAVEAQISIEHSITSIENRPEGQSQDKEASFMLAAEQKLEVTNCTSAGLAVEREGDSEPTKEKELETAEQKDMAVARGTETQEVCLALEGGRVEDEHPVYSEYQNLAITKRKGLALVEDKAFATADQKDPAFAELKPPSEAEKKVAKVLKENGPAVVENKYPTIVTEGKNGTEKEPPANAEMEDPSTEELEDSVSVDNIKYPSVAREKDHPITKDNDEEFTEIRGLCITKEDGAKAERKKLDTIDIQNPAIRDLTIDNGPKQNEDDSSQKKSISVILVEEEEKLNVTAPLVAQDSSHEGDSVHMALEPETKRRTEEETRECLTLELEADSDMSCDSIVYTAEVCSGLSLPNIGRLGEMLPEEAALETEYSSNDQVRLCCETLTKDNGRKNDVKSGNLVHEEEDVGIQDFQERPGVDESEVHDNRDFENLVEHTDVQDLPKEHKDVQDLPVEHTDVQDPHEQRKDVQDPTKKRKDVQDSPKKRKNVQDPPEECKDVQDPPEEHKDVQDPPVEHTDIEDPHEERKDVHDSSEEHNDVQDPPEEHKDVQDPPMERTGIQDPHEEHKDVQNSSEEHKDVQDPPEENKDFQKHPEELKDVQDPPEEHKDVQDSPEEHKDVQDPPEEHKNVQDPHDECKDVQDPPEEPMLVRSRCSVKRKLIVQDSNHEEDSVHMALEPETKLRTEEETRECLTPELEADSDMSCDSIVYTAEVCSGLSLPNIGRLGEMIPEEAALETEYSSSDQARLCCETLTNDSGRKNDVKSGTPVHEKEDVGIQDFQGRPGVDESEAHDNRDFDNLVEHTDVQDPPKHKDIQDPPKECKDVQYPPEEHTDVQDPHEQRKDVQDPHEEPKDIQDPHEERKEVQDPPEEPTRQSQCSIDSEIIPSSDPEETPIKKITWRPDSANDLFKGVSSSKKPIRTLAPPETGAGVTMVVGGRCPVKRNLITQDSNHEEDSVHMAVEPESKLRTEEETRDCLTLELEADSDISCDSIVYTAEVCSGLSLPNIGRLGEMIPEEAALETEYSSNDQVRLCCETLTKDNGRKNDVKSGNLVHEEEDVGIQDLQERPGVDESEVHDNRDFENLVEHKDVQDLPEEHTDVQDPHEERKDGQDPHEEHKDVQDPTKEHKDVQDPHKKRKDVQDSPKKRKNVQDPTEECKDVQDHPEEHKEVQDPPMERTGIQDPHEERKDVQDPTKEHKDVQDPHKKRKDVQYSPKKRKNVQDPPEECKDVQDHPEEHKEVQDPPMERTGIQDPHEERKDVQDSSDEHKDIQDPPEEHKDIQDSPEEHKDVQDPHVEQTDIQDPHEERKDVQDPPEEHKDIQDSPEEHKDIQYPPEEHKDVQDPHVEHTDIQDPSVEHTDVQDPPEEHTDIQDPPEEHKDVQDPPEEHKDVQDPTEEHKDLQDPPVEHTYVQDPPVEHTYIQDPPVEHTDIQDPPVENTYVQDPPVEHTYVQDPPVEHTYIQDPPVEHTDIQDPPEDPPVEHTDIQDPPDEHKDVQDPPEEPTLVRSRCSVKRKLIAQDSSHEGDSVPMALEPETKLRRTEETREGDIDSSSDSIVYNLDVCKGSLVLQSKKDENNSGKDAASPLLMSYKQIPEEGMPLSEENSRLEMQHPLASLPQDLEDETQPPSDIQIDTNTEDDNPCLSTGEGVCTELKRPEIIKDSTVKPKPQVAGRELTGRGVLPSELDDETQLVSDVDTDEEDGLTTDEQNVCTKRPEIFKGSAIKPKVAATELTGHGVMPCELDDETQLVSDVDTDEEDGLTTDKQNVCTEVKQPEIFMGSAIKPKPEVAATELTGHGVLPCELDGETQLVSDVDTDEEDGLTTDEQNVCTELKQPEIFMGSAIKPKPEVAATELLGQRVLPCELDGETQLVSDIDTDEEDGSTTVRTDLDTELREPEIAKNSAIKPQSEIATTKLTGQRMLPCELDDGTQSVSDIDTDEDTGSTTDAQDFCMKYKEPQMTKSPAKQTQPEIPVQKLPDHPCQLDDETQLVSDVDTDEENGSTTEEQHVGSELKEPQMTESPAKQTQLECQVTKLIDHPCELDEEIQLVSDIDTDEENNSATDEQDVCMKYKETQMTKSPSMKTQPEISITNLIDHPCEQECKTQLVPEVDTDDGSTIDRPDVWTKLKESESVENSAIKMQPEKLRGHLCDLDDETQRVSDIDTDEETCSADGGARLKERKVTKTPLIKTPLSQTGEDVPSPKTSMASLNECKESGNTGNDSLSEADGESDGGSQTTICESDTTFDDDADKDEFEVLEVDGNQPNEAKYAEIETQLFTSEDHEEIELQHDSESQDKVIYFEGYHHTDVKGEEAVHYAEAATQDFLSDHQTGEVSGCNDRQKNQDGGVTSPEKNTGSDDNAELEAQVKAETEAEELVREQATRGTGISEQQSHDEMQACKNKSENEESPQTATEISKCKERHKETSLEVQLQNEATKRVAAGQSGYVPRGVTTPSTCCSRKNAPAETRTQGTSHEHTKSRSPPHNSSIEEGQFSDVGSDEDESLIYLTSRQRPQVSPIPARSPRYSSPRPSSRYDVLRSSPLTSSPQTPYRPLAGPPGRGSPGASNSNQVWPRQNQRRPLTAQHRPDHRSPIAATARSTSLFSRKPAEGSPSSKPLPVYSSPTTSHQPVPSGRLSRDTSHSPASGFAASNKENIHTTPVASPSVAEEPLPGSSKSMGMRLLAKRSREWGGDDGPTTRKRLHREEGDWGSHM